MEQFDELVAKKGLPSALREEASAALSHPLEALQSLKKPIAEATLLVGSAYLAHKFGPAAVEKGAALVSPLAKEIGATLKMDAFGPKFALAEGLPLAEGEAAAAKLFARPLKPAETAALEKPLQMTASGGTGGGAADFQYRRTVTPAGETLHDFNNVKVRDASNNIIVNHIDHADQTRVHFAHEGGLYVGFPGSSSYRLFQLGTDIKSVHIKESMNGVKEYSFNGDGRTAMIVNPANHDVIGYPVNGDRIYIADNRPAGLIFQHSHGGAIHISTGGQVEISPPGGKAMSTSVGSHFRQVYYTERKDGGISLRFSDSNENMMSGEISLPGEQMMPQQTAPKQPNLLRNPGSSWRSPFQRGGVNTAGDNVDLFRYDAQGGHNHHDAFNPFNIPTSPERAIDAKLTGVPGGMVSGSRLDSPADMFTAQSAGNNRWLGRWLMNLGKPED